MKDFAKPFVLDTNVLLYCISCGVKETPDNNSPLDRSTRTRKTEDSNRIDPEQVRGAIICLLQENPVIIPQVVLEELKSRKTEEMLGDKNKKNLELVLKSVSNQATTFVAQRIEVIRQNYLVEKIKTKALAFVESLRKRGIDIPEGWENNLSPKRGSNPPPLNNLESDQACLTWAKICHDEPKVRANILKLPPSGETKQRQILSKAKEISQRLDRPETTQEEITTLAPELAKLEIQAEEEKPFFIPDFEILFLAKRKKACIYSLDNDLCLLEKELSQGEKLQIVKTTTGPWATIEDFSRHLKSNINKQPKDIQNYGNLNLI